MISPLWAKPILAGNRLVQCSLAVLEPREMEMEMEDRTEVLVQVQEEEMCHHHRLRFNIGIKPKDPPIFHGKAYEDIDTWLAKVGDFLYLTEANDWQQVAYAATLMQDTAAD